MSGKWVTNNDERSIADKCNADLDELQSWPKPSGLPAESKPTALADPTGEPMVTFKSGAKRSEKALRYDLLPSEGLRRLAARYTMGSAKYGDDNWKRGLRDPEYIAQFKAHLIAHWIAYLEDGCTKDDNLSAIAWGAFALMEAEKVARTSE